MDLVIVVLLLAGSFLTGVAAQAHAKEEKRRSLLMVFGFGYRYWELKDQGKKLRLWSYALGVSALVVAGLVAVF